MYEAVFIRSRALNLSAACTSNVEWKTPTFPTLASAGRMM
jgi:hypothetical protein